MRLQVVPGHIIGVDDDSLDLWGQFLEPLAQDQGSQGVARIGTPQTCGKAIAPRRAVVVAFGDPGLLKTHRNGHLSDLSEMQVFAICLRCSFFLVVVGVFKIHGLFTYIFFEKHVCFNIHSCYMCLQYIILCFF